MTPQVLIVLGVFLASRSRWSRRSRSCSPSASPAAGARRCRGRRGVRDARGARRRPRTSIHPDPPVGAPSSSARAPRLRPPVAAQGDPARRRRRALHDEDAIYAREVAGSEKTGGERDTPSTGTASRSSFKGVLLEGLEVVLHRREFGSTGRPPRPRRGSAPPPLLVVGGVGVARAPSAEPVSRRTPMKFVVGIMLTSFGVFWGGEGAAGVSWPGS